MRLYLLTLEVAPLTVDETYNPLPSHLTLMHRFRSELSPEALAKDLEPVFQKQCPVTLTFGATKIHGPQKVRVHSVALTDQLKRLHLRLFNLLQDLGVEFTAPQWVGEGFGPHVTERAEVEFTPGDQQLSRAAYLIEVEIRGEDHLRLIRAKFGLKWYQL